MRPLHLFAVIGFLTLALPASGRANPGDVSKSGDPLEKERREAFAWLNGLGYPDASGLQFVRVNSGPDRIVIRGNGITSQRGGILYGFLIEDKETSFTVMLLDLGIVTFQRPGPNAPPNEQVSFTLADLGKAAAEQIELSALGTAGRSGVYFLDPVTHEWTIRNFIASGRVELFTLAWACARHSMNATAARLYAQARVSEDTPADDRIYYELRSVRTAPVAPTPSRLAKGFRDKLSDAIARSQLDEALGSIDDLQTSRSKILKHFEKFNRNFPKHEYHARVRDMMAQLRRLIAEDSDNAVRRKKGLPFEKLGKSEQISDLIFRLRDQTGFRNYRSGECDIFSSDQSSPANLLVDLGYDAVPALIDALDDKRLTRAVSILPVMELAARSEADPFVLNRVLTVGQCAEALLREISGLPFVKPADKTGKIELPDAEYVKTNARAWYAELKAKGEKAWLIEIVRRGDNLKLAQRLREKYPDEALPALIAGARAANASLRAEMINAVGTLDGTMAVPFFVDEAKHGPKFAGRIAAARCLDERERPEGVAAMIEEWRDQKFAKEGVADNELVQYLIDSGKSEAITALAQSYPRQPIRQRLELILMLINSESIRTAFQPRSVVSQNADKLRTAVEDFLLDVLDDTDRRIGADARMNDKRYLNPRMCDLAGFILGELDSAKFTFSTNAPLAGRNKFILDMKNQRRLKNNLPPLTMRQPPAFAKVFDRQLDPLLDAFVSGNVEERIRAQAEIEKLGLGTFLGILNRRDAVKKEDDARRLDDLAKRVACIVSDVEIVEGSLAPDAALKKRLEAMRGKPLGSKTFVDDVVTIFKNWPAEGPFGMRLIAERSGDGTGFMLHVDLIRADRVKSNPDATRAQPRADMTGPPTALTSYEHMFAGAELQWNSEGTCNLASWPAVSAARLEAALATVLSASPGASIEIDISASFQWREKATAPPSAPPSKKE